MPPVVVDTVARFSLLLLQFNEPSQMFAVFFYNAVTLTATRPPNLFISYSAEYTRNSTDTQTHGKVLSVAEHMKGLVAKGVPATCLQKISL